MHNRVRFLFAFGLISCMGWLWGRCTYSPACPKRGGTSGSQAGPCCSLRNVPMGLNRREQKSVLAQACTVEWRAGLRCQRPPCGGRKRAVWAKEQRVSFWRWENPLPVGKFAHRCCKSELRQFHVVQLNSDQSVFGSEISGELSKEFYLRIWSPGLSFRVEYLDS